MKTALLIISHPRVNKVVAQNWPWYVKSGGDVIGVCDRGTGCVWPKGVKRVLEFDEIDDQRGKLIGRFFQVLEWCVVDSQNGGYDRYAISEYDVCFVRPIPYYLPPFVATRAGQKSPGFCGQYYYHCPWILSGNAACQLLTQGRKMLKAGIDESGHIDRFIGLFDDLYDAQIQSGANYSRNSLDRPEYIREAQEAVKNPECFAVHGVKTPDQLEAVTQNL